MVAIPERVVVIIIGEKQMRRKEQVTVPIQKAGITNFFTAFENHGGNLGVMLYFQRGS